MPTKNKPKKTTRQKHQQAGPGAYNPTANAETEPAPSSPERINASGLVRIADEATVSSLPIHFYSERARWYGPNGQGGFTSLSTSQAASLIAEHGFNRSVKDSQGNTAADRAMLWLIQHRAVDYAGPLSGYPAGLHTIGTKRILITESLRFIEPKPGNWSVIKLLVETLLADIHHPQKDIFYTWASASYRALWERRDTSSNTSFRHCPALALFGPRGCGKSALIDLVLTPLFGGRKGDPMNFLREGRFNKDLFGASLLVMDDKGSTASLHERRQRGEALKDLIWKAEQRMEGKGADAIMLRPFWRLVIAGNDDDAGLQVCPALSPSLEEKMILLKAVPASGLPTTNEENDRWVDAIQSEVPGFAAFLLGYQPPQSLSLDTRTRVLSFWHPELVSALQEMQPEMRMLELIDSLNLLEGRTHWEGSASEFERAMRGKESSGMLDRIFTNGQAAGRMLSELSRSNSDRVQWRNWSNARHYIIFPAPPKSSDETNNSKYHSQPPTTPNRIVGAC